MSMHKEKVHARADQSLCKRVSQWQKVRRGETRGGKDEQRHGQKLKHAQRITPTLNLAACPALAAIPNLTHTQSRFNPLSPTKSSAQT